MIVAAILILSLVVLVVVFARFSGFASIDLSTVLVYIRLMVPYISAGIRFINSFTNAAVVMPLGLAAVSLHVIYSSYKFVMWIVKKIPMFGVSD